eukprot:1144885-Pelagomonas_calceolata.AAC.7
MTDLFKRRAVMDVAWMPDGMSMVACSVEGTIAAFQFTEEDLGEYRQGLVLHDAGCCDCGLNGDCGLSKPLTHCKMHCSCFTGTDQAVHSAPCKAHDSALVCKEVSLV